MAVLHLLRVFFTGAHRPPREVNWIFGVVMLLLVLDANFTGYLLRWDQLAFWAITVGTSLVSYIPFVGDQIGSLLLGGPEVTGATLLNVTPFLEETSDAAIRQIVTHGVPGTSMPAWGDRMTDVEIQPIVVFIRSWDGTAPDVATPTGRGRQGGGGGPPWRQREASTI